MLGFWPLGFLPLGFFEVAAGAGLTAAVTATEADDTAGGASSLELTAATSATESNDTAAGSAALSLEAAVTATEANDTAAGAAVIGVATLSASVAVTEQDDTAAGTAEIQVPFSDVPILPLVWQPPPKPRKKLSIAAVIAERVPDVGHIPTPLPKMPAFDVAGALDKARQAALLEARQINATRRADALAVAQKQAIAKAQAAKAAREKAEADDEDDVEMLLLFA